jgi:hypothetical protein
MVWISSASSSLPPFETNVTTWQTLPWVDRSSGQPYRISTAADTGGAGVARVRTYRDVRAAFRTHPEVKSAGSDGRPCGRQTVGLLAPRVVQETYVAHVGKEANKLEEVDAGLERDPEVVYTEYHRPDRDEWAAVILPALRTQNLAAFARACGVTERQLRSLVAGRSRPHAKSQARILHILYTFKGDAGRGSQSSSIGPS